MAKQRRYVRQMPKIYGNLQKPKRSYAWLGVLLKRTALLLIGAAAVYGLFFSGFFTIKKVEVEGAVFSDSGQISKYVRIGAPIWSISPGEIRSQIVQNDAIDSAAVLRGIPDSVKIIVKEKSPRLLWVSGSTTAVLDDTGTIFTTFSSDGIPSSETSLGKVLATVPKVVDTKALPIQPDHQVVSTNFITFVGNVKTQLASYLPEVTIDHLEIVDTTYDVTVITSQGMQVQFSTLADPAVQVRNLTRLVKQGKASLTAKVDLRIDRWAYVHP